MLSPILRTSFIPLITYLFIGTVDAAVEDWCFLKGKGGIQVSDNTAPSISFYDIDCEIVLSSVGDATSVTISGGGISGSLPFEQEGADWFLERSYGSEAAQDAEFPSNATYTITLSGGTLGTLTQELTIGEKAYPDIPFLTGTTFSELQSVNPNGDFVVDFADPGSLATLTEFDIEEGSGNDFNSNFSAEIFPPNTSVTVPGGTLRANNTYTTFLDHFNEALVSGVGGFGVDGLVGYDTFVELSVVTAESESALVGAWEFGNGASDASDVIVFLANGYYFHAEDGDGSPFEPDGMEKGTYTWNETTGAFTATVIVDTDGELGLSHITSIVGTIVGDELTFAHSGGSGMLNRVISGTNPLVGGWQFGDPALEDSGVLVFLSNGIYFHAEDIGVEESASDGMERGTYVWNETTGALTATTLVDTNGDIGLSHPIGGDTASVVDNVLTIADNSDSSELFRVGAQAPNGAVTHWRFVKGVDFEQSADNTAPSESFWSAFAIVQTENEGDATSVTISGGGISGSHAFDQEDTEWELGLDFATEAALDAEFPSGATYTITLSGGTLGTLTQAFTLGSKAYPNAPYLTGTVFTDLQSLDPNSDFVATFSQPGALTASSGVTVFEVFDEFDDESIYRVLETGATTSALIPSGSLQGGNRYLGFLEYTNAQAANGTGGFGIEGTTSHNVGLEFWITTVLSPLLGAWQFGDGVSDASGVLVFLSNGIYFHAQDTVADSFEFDGMERGTYTWNETTGAFTASPILDTNGEIGLSHPIGSFVLTIAGDELTVNDGEAATLSRVFSDTNPLIGGWLIGDGMSLETGIGVFLPNGSYFHAEDILENDEFESDGIERGTYDWNESTGALTATPIIDTNGEIGLSHPIGDFVFTVTGDILNAADDEGVAVLRRVGPANTEVGGGIVDAGLEQAIRDAIGKPSGELTVGDLQGLTSLSAMGRSIVDLTGLGNASNLDELNLSNNEISDLSSLAVLTRIKRLDLSGNRISDLEPIKGLVNVTYLDVSGNLLEDPEPASSLLGGIQVLSSDLKSLPLASGSALDPLRGITELSTLLLAKNNIRNLEPLSLLAGLEKVDVSNNDVTDLTPLASLEELKEITLFGNPVDLSEGSSQLVVLQQISTNTGASIVLVDPNPTNLRLEIDSVTGVLDLIWPAGWLLETSSNLENWVDVLDAQSPYTSFSESGSRSFWRIREEN